MEINEKRINQLYACHNTASWAKTSLSVLADMLDEKQEHIHFPPRIEWVREKVIKIRDGIKLIPKDETME